jgi:DNA-binding NarL/FixJ family response regulator
MAKERGQRAAALGRSTSDPGLEFTGLALEGLARVSAGDVAAGMRCLDEASTAATAGEVKELHTVGVVCCWQIFACERVADYDRAAQWCARVQEFTRRWGLRPLSGICRTQYAGVLIWRGKWAEAESELASASKELEAARPGTATQPLARLGQLRLRQGRLDEAAALFARAGSQPLARLGQVALALERASPDDAVAEVERFLALPDSREPNLRAAALELAVQAHAAAGATGRARAACEELAGIAQAVATSAINAALAAAEGLVRQKTGDAEGALGCWERAVTLYEDSGAPYETARARLHLADALAATGQRAAAERATREAARVFEQLGAVRKRESPSLTGRQLEIMRLVAQGLSNHEIARRLKLSDHTVKRHLANILTRLGLPTRAAAVAYAARQGLLPPSA